MVTLLPKLLPTPIPEIHPICIYLLEVSAAILHAWIQCPISLYSACVQLFFTPGDSVLYLFTRRVYSYSSHLETVLHQFTRRVCSYFSRLETVSYISLLDVCAAILHTWRQSYISLHDACAAILQDWRQYPISLYSTCLQLFFTPGDSLLHQFTRRVCSYSSRLETFSYIRNSEDAQCALRNMSVV